MPEPLVSVVLPLYNASGFITETIHSLLNQSFRDFELIIIDDGSKDDSVAKVKALHDPRIKLYEQENRGMAATINRGIELSTGKFIARSDGDDLSHPDRLHLQLSYMTTHSTCALLGSWAHIIEETGKDTGRRHEHPTGSDAIRLFLMFDNPFVHSSVMIRREAIVQVGGYNTDKAPVVQDYELWSRIAVRYPVANLPSYLIQYREVSKGMSQTIKTYKTDVIRQSALNMAGLLETNTEGPVSLLASFYQGVFEPALSTTRLKALLDLADQLARGITAGNMERYDAIATERIFFEKRLRNQWLNYRIEAHAKGSPAWLYHKIMRKFFYSKL
jgi:glycosyltransferase involved in cell wall biosynthesis